MEKKFEERRERGVIYEPVNYFRRLGPGNEPAIKLITVNTWLILNYGGGSWDR